MPLVSSEHKHPFKSTIRALLSQNPQITQRGLLTSLEQEVRRLNREHLGTLVNGIYRERARRADTWTLNTALAAFQDA